MVAKLNLGAERAVQSELPRRGLVPAPVKYVVPSIGSIHS